MIGQISGAFENEKKLWGSNDTAPKTGKLEVNVVFTDAEHTAIALRTATSLARDLGASINLIAGQAVPYPLPLDEPPVPVDFTKKVLGDLLCKVEEQDLEIAAHLYLCRDRLQMLLKVLTPGSLVVICGRKRWWPTAEGRLARKLRSNGFKVLLVD